MRYASSYGQKKYYDYLYEIHFSRISQVMDYFLNTPNPKRGCLEILEVGSINFNNEPTTYELYHDIFTKFKDNLRFEFWELKDLIEYRKKYADDLISYHYPAENYNLLNTLLYYNVSDILLNEPMVFDLPNVSKFIRNKSVYGNYINIHVRPDHGKPEFMPINESILHHFWLLPQHVNIYSPYIDVIDLFAVTPQREERLVKAYCTDQSYENELGAFVLNYAASDMDMDARMVTEDLVQRRLDCNQICLTKYPPRCHMCDIEQSLYHLSRERYLKSLENDKEI